MIIGEKVNDLYEKVINSVDEINYEINIPVSENKRKNMLSKLIDYFVANSFRQNHNISDHKIKIGSQYFEIIDNILIGLNRRFKGTELIKAVEACNPNI